MKNFLGISLLALSSIFGGVAIEDRSKQAPVNQEIVPQFRLGKEAVAEIRKGYESGQYDLFLREMDDFYHQINQDGRIQEFSSLREGYPIDSKLGAQIKEIQRSKNEQFLAIAEGNNTLFAEKLRFMASNPSSEKEEEAFLFLSSIRQKPLQGGSSQDENTLIAIDLEYECKSLHLKQSSLGEGSHVDPRVGQCVLKMQQMDKMQLASESFENAHFKELIQVAAQHADLRMAQNWDSLDLHALVTGKQKPSDRLQEQTVSILQNHQEKLSDLYIQSMGG